MGGLLIILGILIGFGVGLGVRHRAGVLIDPLVAMLGGALIVGEERPNYDMHGFGYYMGGLCAILAGAVWLLARWVRSRPPAG